MKSLDKAVGYGVLVLAFGAFVLSFEKLHHVAVEAGISIWLAWIYPLIVEGFTTIATLAAFLKRGKEGAWYPWCVGGLAFTFSLFANAVPSNVPVELVRAVPVICIPLMVHMFVIIKGFAEVAEAEAEAAAEVIAQAEIVAQEIVATVEEAPEAPKPTYSPRVAKALSNMREQARTASTKEARAYWTAKVQELAMAN